MIYIINDLIQNPQKFFSTFDHYLDVLKGDEVNGGFEVEEIRHREIQFKFYNNDINVYKMTIPNFLTQLCMFIPIMKLNAHNLFKFNKEFILDFKKLSTSQLCDYMDFLVLPTLKKYYDFFEYSDAMSEWRESLKLSKDFTLIMGMTINLHREIQMMKKNQRYKEIISTKLGPDLQPAEREKINAELRKEIVEIIKANPDHYLYPMIMSGGGINVQQFAECSINAGNKPDMMGNVIAEPLDTNYLYHGLDSITHFFIDASGGRKAAVMNDKFTGKAGYFARKLSLLNFDTELSPDVDDCGTPNYTKFKVYNDHPDLTDEKSNLKRLEMINGRYYKLSLEDEEEHVVNFKKDKHLIGKVIYIRTPCKCGLEGDHICKKCYGDLSYDNKNISIGIFAAQNISEQMTQNILSSKHLLATISRMIMFDESTFNLFFQLDGNLVTLNEELDLTSDAYKIIIDEEDIKYSDEMEEDLYYNKSCSKFAIYGSGGIPFIIEEQNLTNLIITPYLEKILKKKGNKYVADLRKAYKDIHTEFEGDEPLFEIEIANSELTKVLKDLENLLDKKEHSYTKEEFPFITIDDLINKGCELMIQGKIDRDLVHLEISIRNIIREAENIMKRPDFSKPESQLDYQILTVKKALLEHPSLSVTLSFEDIKRRIFNPSIFDKVKSSKMDVFYLESPQDYIEEKRELRKGLRQVLA